MAKTCLDCSVLDPLQGLHAHPIFQSPEEWAIHLYLCHGGPKPAPTIPPEEKPPELPAPIPAADEEIRAALATLEAQVAGQAAINEDFGKRLAVLENTPERLKPTV